jgi:hypothetical protein
MQMDIPKTYENLEDPTTLIIAALSQPIALFIPIPVTLPLEERKKLEVPPLTLVPQVLVTQCLLPMISVEVPMIRSKIPEVSLPIETRTQLVQIEQKTK